jgi:protein required for attachment to host cells
MMNLGGVTLIVAADGSRARFFEERRRFGDICERPELALAEHDGRPSSHRHRATVHDRFGFGRHGAGGQDWREARAARFLKRVADQIDRAARRRRFDELVVIAPPRALGLLKEALSEATKARLAATDAHDAVRERCEKIRSRMSAIRATA